MQPIPIPSARYSCNQCEYQTNDKANFGRHGKRHSQGPVNGYVCLAEGCKSCDIQSYHLINQHLNGAVARGDNGHIQFYQHNRVALNNPTSRERKILLAKMKCQLVKAQKGWSIANANNHRESLQVLPVQNMPAPPNEYSAAQKELSPKSDNTSPFDLPTPPALHPVSEAVACDLQNAIESEDVVINKFPGILPDLNKLPEESKSDNEYSAAQKELSPKSDNTSPFDVRTPPALHPVSEAVACDLQNAIESKDVVINKFPGILPDLNKLPEESKSDNEYSAAQKELSPKSDNTSPFDVRTPPALHPVSEAVACDLQNAIESEDVVINKFPGILPDLNKLPEESKSDTVSSISEEISQATLPYKKRMSSLSHSNCKRQRTCPSN